MCASDDLDLSPFDARNTWIAIILFSGLGSIEDAQETLSVGVGALAGSTIMLLTVPWALSVYGGRVDLLPGSNKPNYMGKPKLTTPKAKLSDEYTKTGIAITTSVQRGGIIMVLTTIPYFLIQVPALFLHGPTEEVASGEHWWSFSGLIVCLLGLTYYMHLQLVQSKEGEDKDKRIAVMKKVLNKGELSLAGVLGATIRSEKADGASNGGQYSSLSGTDASSPLYPPPHIAEYLKDVLLDAFKAYDNNGNGQLERAEIQMFFKDFHERISDEDMDNYFKLADSDGDGTVSFHEFIGLTYNLIVSHDQQHNTRLSNTKQELVDNLFGAKSKPGKTNEDGADDDDGIGGEEEEEIPEEFHDLSPDEQQVAIKKRAFQMLALGTIMVVYFSDPMVDVMQEIAVRAHLSPFYVSFVLAPLASNASEVLASQYYASKKTRKTITVSLSALEGAASMNNTFW